MTDITDVLTFTATEATAADLDRIIAAVQTRRKFFGAARAATVTIGADVTLTGLSPKALNGLKGEVTQIKSNRCDVSLDEDSTLSLACGRTKFAMSAMSAKDGRYLLRGVPLTCCTIEGVA